MELIIGILFEAGIDIWSVVRWFYFLAFGIYFIFSLIVWRQVQLMSNTLNGVLRLPIQLVGVGLVLVSAVALAIALMVL